MIPRARIICSKTLRIHHVISWLPSDGIQCRRFIKSAYCRADYLILYIGAKISAKTKCLLENQMKQESSKQAVKITYNNSRTAICRWRKWCDDDIEKYYIAVSVKCWPNFVSQYTLKGLLTRPRWQIPRLMVETKAVFSGLRQVGPIAATLFCYPSSSCKDSDEAILDMRTSRGHFGD